MANKTLLGFRPLRNINGMEIALTKVQAVSNPTTGIFKHDSVVWTGAGWDLATAGTSNPVGSICMGAEYRRSSDNKITKEPYLPSGTTYTEADGEDGVSWLWIVANPADTIFEAQVDEVIAETDMNLNYNFVATSAGSTVTGLSGQQLDATGRAITATLQFRVLRFVKNINNDRTLTNASVECMINGNAGAAGRVPSLNTTGG